MPSQVKWLVKRKNLDLASVFCSLRSGLAIRVEGRRRQFARVKYCDGRPQLSSAVAGLTTRQLVLDRLQLELAVQLFERELAH